MRIKTAGLLFLAVTGRAAVAPPEIVDGVAAVVNDRVITYSEVRMLAMPVVDMAAALPISVSGLGVREKTFETLMAALCGLPEATGVAASLAGWLFNVFWGLIGGAIFILFRARQPEGALIPGES